MRVVVQNLFRAEDGMRASSRNRTMLRGPPSSSITMTDADDSDMTVNSCLLKLWFLFYWLVGKFRSDEVLPLGDFKPFSQFPFITSPSLYDHKPI